MLAWKDRLKSTCNCNYIFIRKVALVMRQRRDGPFWSSGQAATCPFVQHARWRLHTVLFDDERQEEKL